MTTPHQSTLRHHVVLTTWCVMTNTCDGDAWLVLAQPRATNTVPPVGRTGGRFRASLPQDPSRHRSPRSLRRGYSCPSPDPPCACDLCECGCGQVHVSVDEGVGVSGVDGGESFAVNIRGVGEQRISYVPQCVVVLAYVVMIVCFCFPASTRRACKPRLQHHSCCRVTCAVLQGLCRRWVQAVQACLLTWLAWHTVSSRFCRSSIW